MPIASSDLVFYKSIQAASNGGTIDTTRPLSGTLNELFNDVVVPAAGSVSDYVKIFIKNNHATLALQNAALYFDIADGTYESLDVALGTASDTDGSGYTYTHPTTRGTSTAVIASLVAGSAQGVWLKRTVQSQASAVNKTYNLSIQGDTAA
jgi:hypothetical protein